MSAVSPFNHSRIVVVGSSTGGTEALRVFLSMMPQGSPPILIAQHMPEMFVTSFVARLDGACALHVKVAEQSEPILRGYVYLSPGHSHIALERQGEHYRIALSDAAPVNRHRPSVEVLFRSAARALGAKAVGIMLTGMGKDGAVAMLEMKRAGAYNLAQDESSSVVFGMPRAAIELGAVDEVVPLEKMAECVLRHC
jgi:two-component system chemotaxis response regulator CheB